MRSAEFRRLAEQKLVEAATLAADADRLRAQAAALRGLLDPIVPMSQRVWVGPAAEDFQAKTRLHSQQINLQSARLARIAIEFDHEADGLRRDAVALQNQAVVDEAGAASRVVPTGVVR